MSKSFNHASLRGEVEAVRKGKLTIVYHDTEKAVKERARQRMLKYMALSWEFKIKTGKKKTYKITIR